MQRARACRRRRFPAFGEWNNLGDGDAGGWTAAVVNQYFVPVTAHKSLKEEFNGYHSGVVAMGKQQHKVARQTWVDDSGTHVAMQPFSFVAVKAVDDDLYDVPPDMLCAKPLRVCMRLIFCIVSGSLQHKKELDLLKKMIDCCTCTSGL